MAGGYINMNKQVKMTSCGKTENNHMLLLMFRKVLAQ